MVKRRLAGIASSAARPLEMTASVVRRAVSLLRNNTDAIEATKTIFLEPAKRDEGVVELVQIFLQKLLSPAVRRGRESAKGFASHVLASDGWTSGQLEGVPHFGALEALLPLRVSRADYALLVVLELLLMKEKYANLGLGSRSTGVRFGGVELTSLELLQTWGLLHNLGHLHGTFATERAVLQMAHDSPDVMKGILRGIDTSVREGCRDVLEGAHPNRVHYALAAFRVSQWKANATRSTALQCLKVHLEAGAALRERGLLQIYKRARQLAYGRIHQMAIPNARPHRLDDTPPEGLFSELFLPHEHMEEDNPVVEALDNADRAAHQIMFTSRRAAAVIAAHTRSTETWWARQTKASVEDRVALLFHEPPDWPAEESKPIHVTRVELGPIVSDWVDEARQWREALRQHDATVVVHSVPGDPGLIVDVFAARVLPPAGVVRLATLMSSHAIASWVGDDKSAARRLWRSYASFGAQVMQMCLKKGYQIAVRPVSTGDSDKHFGYAVLAPSVGQARDRLKLVGPKLADEARQREVAACRDVLAREPDAPCLVFLGKTWIVNADGDQERELDGICVLFRTNAIEFLVLEHKSAGGGASGQLDGVREYLTTEVAPATPAGVSDGRCSVIRWSIPIDTPSAAPR